MVNNTYPDKLVDNFNEKFNISCLKDVHCIIKCVTKSLRLVYGTSIIVIYPCCQQPTHIQTLRQSSVALQGCYKTWASCMAPWFQPVTVFRLQGFLLTVTLWFSQFAGYIFVAYDFIVVQMSLGSLWSVLVSPIGQNTLFKF